MKKVVLVNLTSFERVLPLSSGYLQAYACTDKKIRDTHRFSILSMTVRTERDRILRDLEAAEGDIYGFSCYCWNMKLVSSLLPSLLERRPQAGIILGGPQVGWHGGQYLDPSFENLVLCNGEGEKTFRNYLRQLDTPSPDLQKVKGLSFFRDGSLVTTDDEDPIDNLDEIPSPFLTEVFERNTFTTALLETNRGCPFGCAYCVWGTSRRVREFGEHRVKADIEWLCRNNYFYVWLIDGNWGLLPRDVELTKHIAGCKARHGMPFGVFFHGSKKHPERLLEITGILNDAGAVTPLSVALQSLNPTALKNVNRVNAPLEGFITLQDGLRKRGLDSHLELIWPLPGETLETFSQGVGRLCEYGVDSFLIYPCLLLNNTSLEKDKHTFGLVTVREPSDTSEIHLVVQTREVSRKDYEAGIWFAFAVLLLYSLRYAYGLGHYLNRTGGVRYEAFFFAFVEWCRAHSGHRLVAYYQKAVDGLVHLDFHTIGEVIQMALHSHREGVGVFVDEFVASQDWWSDHDARAFYEMDIVNRPYVYINTPVRCPPYCFEQVDLIEVLRDGYLVEVPECCLPYMATLVGGSSRALHGARVFRVNHRQKQLAFVGSGRADVAAATQNVFYCQEKLHSIRSILPQWVVADVSGVEGGGHEVAGSTALDSDVGDFAFQPDNKVGA